MLCGCGTSTVETSEPEVVESIESEFDTTVSEEASNAEMSSADSGDHAVIPDTCKEVKLVSISDSYDTNDDSTMQNGMYTKLEDSAGEEEFLSYFFEDPSGLQIIEDAYAKVYMGMIDDKNIFVALISDEESEPNGYPKYAYGFRYSTENAVSEAYYDSSKKGAEVFDTIIAPDGTESWTRKAMKPLWDYQEKTITKNDDGTIAKVEYLSDSKTYGTYNSSGDLYYDKKERPWYRYYYVTSGSRYCFYIYDEEDNILQCLDFGGMPYKVLESNPDIAIGVDVEVYLFER
jgi:hypothetical protein